MVTDKGGAGLLEQEGRSVATMVLSFGRSEEGLPVRMRFRDSSLALNILQETTFYIACTYAVHR